MPLYITYGRNMLRSDNTPKISDIDIDMKSEEPTFIAQEILIEQVKK